MTIKFTAPTFKALGKLVETCDKHRVGAMLVVVVILALGASAAIASIAFHL